MKSDLQNRWTATRCFARGVLASMFLAALPGCYDAGALQEAHREETATVKLAEVDLGAFHITLPQATGDAGGWVVDFHAFGRVSPRDREAVAKAVNERRAELRSHMLLAIRSVTNEELAQPKLDALREEIGKVINGALDKKRVKSVGFYEFSFTTL